MSAVLVEDGPDKGAVWHFGEPVKEQRALEAGTAWADLSHYSVISVSGEDRLKWLHDLTTQFVSDLQPGVWMPGMILDAKGHVEYQFNLVDDGAATFLVLDPGYADNLVEYLTKMKFMLRVEVADVSDTYVVLRTWCANRNRWTICFGSAHRARRNEANLWWRRNTSWNLGLGCRKSCCTSPTYWF
jgi:folate-binding Fe-S cluster repair protein YgfZ